MPRVIADRRDVDFVLYEQLQVEELIKYERYSDLNKKMFDMIITEAQNIGENEILPTFTEGDREGVRLVDGQVRVPDCFRRPYKLIREFGFPGLTEDPEYGGQGLPHVIAQATDEFISGANMSVPGCAAMGHGAGKLIELYGTEQQKELFLEKLYTGEWGGSMVLTESQAGSDVGALTTTAKKNADGTFTITGDKIFISYGDQDLTENIIHPVLARLEGAPGGTKGISIFIAPKIWVNDDGSLGEPNDVVCARVEEKMGLHGSSACNLIFGEKGKCRGLLLGKENQGMEIMFHMMNQARLGTGFTGLMYASSAYLYAVNYARERLQGRDPIEKDPDAPQIPIIRHPDVRRMLISMKAYVEGMRSLIYYVGHLLDKMTCSEDAKEAERYDDLISLITPVVKAYCVERGFDTCVQAIQVYGGYGYTKDYPVEQLARDSKIGSIYEGTDGIQAMDLVGRKMGMKDGKVFMDFLQEINKIIVQAKEIEELKSSALIVEEAAKRFGEIALLMGKKMLSPEYKTGLAFSFPFLEVMGDVIMGWMLLWRAVVAAPKLMEIVGTSDPKARFEKISQDKEAAFYEGLLKSAEFFIHTILPVTGGKMDAIEAGRGTAVEIPEASFGG
ncbi:acyl-CoA dehydrogenase [Thermodesulfobacteriota bacterium]